MSNTIQKHSKRKAQLTIKFGFSKQFFIYYIIICIGFCTASCIENKQTNSLQYNTKAWNKIKDYFNPPVIYKDNYGNYRSPLLLNNEDKQNNVLSNIQDIEYRTMSFINNDDAKQFETYIKFTEQYLFNT